MFKPLYYVWPVLLAGLLLPGGCAPKAEKELSRQALTGEALYNRHCRGCHKVNGIGGNKGTDLSNVGTRRDAAWLERFLRDPKSVDPGNKMARPTLNASQRDAVVNYLTTLR